MNSSDSIADVIVVGAGIVGLMTAWELLKRGNTVTVIDRVEPGREASWAGGGIISRLAPWHYSDDLQHLVAESQNLYPGLCEELHALSGIDPEWTQSGLLCISDDQDLDEGMRWAEEHTAAYEYLPSVELKKRYPQLTAEQSALLLNDVAQIRNPRLLRALIKALETKGLKILGNTPVRRLIIEEGAVNGVQIGHAMYAKEVVLACGAWTAELIPRDFERPEILPIKGQMLLYKAEQGLLDNIILSNDRYLIPRRDGRILAGSSMEEDGYNKSPTIEIKHEIRSFAENILPALSEAKLEAHWTGLRPSIASNEPVIGAHPEIEGLWLNAGHFRYGLTMAPASSMKLIDQMNIS